MQQGTAEALSPGALIGGHYRLVRVAGRGGMGTVWEALNTWTERRVAVKVMEGGEASNGTASPERVERFLREAKATAKVRHANVVDVLDMGNDPEGVGLFIVYEFLDGETLRDLLDRRGSIAPDEALALLTPAMEGVVEAHRCGVIHRDLKPENILLARDSSGRVTPRVIDFGIARTDTSDAPITRAGEVIGTARYMAPEQCRGARDLDARVDVWAFGVILFESLTGRAPFAGDGYHETIAAILTTDAPSLRAERPELPAGITAAIDRALSRDRDARYPTLRALLDALGFATASVTLASAAPLSVTLASASPTRSRAVMAAALVALSFVAFVALRQSSAPATTVTPAVTLAPATVVRAPSEAIAPSPRAPSAPAPMVIAPPATAPVVASAPVASPSRPIASAPRVRRVIAQRPGAALSTASAPVATTPTTPLPNGAPVLEP